VPASGKFQRVRFTVFIEENQYYTIYASNGAYLLTELLMLIVDDVDGVGC